MKHFILLLLVGLFTLSANAQPPNNLIFYGGSGDGQHSNSFSPAANAIFFGGSGDGLSVASNGMLSNNLFFGGLGDGISVASNGATSNSIFFGGIGDGFSNETNNAVSNNIFTGSSGDGFSFNGNAAISNNIFTGGRGDGWSAVVLPLGPLPVKLLSFTAEYAGTAHLVKWVTSEEVNTRHFEVQRSANGTQFETAGSAPPIGSPASGGTYSFRVEHPFTGNNFYRLKIVDLNGSVEYSSIVLLKNDLGVQFSVYPNPAASMLNVRLSSTGTNLSVPAVLYDAAGKRVLQLTLKPGLVNSISLQNITAGMYTLECRYNDKPMIIRFIKN